MSLTTDLLTSIGQGITLTRSGAPLITPGEVVHFIVNTPDLTNLRVPIVGSGDFAVTWLLKSVRFKDALPAPPVADGVFADSLASYLSAANILGGTPIAGVDVPVAGPPLKGAIPPTALAPVTASPAALPDVPPLAPNAPTANDVLSGVPGLLSQLAGRIPLLMSVPVTISVKWKVQRDGVDLVEGTDLLAPNGLDGLSIDLLFAPVFKEFGQEGTSVITVSATVTLHAATESGPPLNPPPLVVNVPDIGLPRVAAMFRNANFASQDGFVFVIAPEKYNLTSDALFGLLKTMQNNLSTLTGFVQVVGFLTGLGDLLDFVPVQPNIQFRATDSVSNLGGIVFDPHWYGDFNAFDEISSVIFLGITGSIFQMYNQPGFDASNGWITFTTGDDMWVTLASFSFTSQEDVAASNEFAKPDATNVYVHYRIGDGYDNKAESVSFKPNP